MGWKRTWRKVRKSVKRSKDWVLYSPAKETYKKLFPDIELPETILGEEAAPDMQDPAILAAIAEERERRRRRKGRGSTILTGPMGLLGRGAIRRPTLLGQ